MKTIIFDLDGTLLDSVTVWEHLGIEYLNRLHIKPLISPEQMDIELEIRNLQEGAQYLKDQYHIEDSVDEIVETMLHLVEKRYLNCELKDLQYEKKVLEQLVQDGYQLYVLTSSFESIAKQCLIKHNIAHLFQAIESIPLGSSKSNGSAYPLFMEKHHLNLNDVIVVEDAFHAIKGVKLLNVKVIAMEETYFAFNIQSKEIADAYVSNYDELYQALKRLFSNL